MRGKKLLTIVASLMFVSTLTYAQFANLPWGNTNYIRVFVSIQSGLMTSAWTDRGDIVKMLELEPVGDGTYMNKNPIWLTGGANYNYIFFSSCAANLMGFTTGYLFAEPIPNGAGQILCDPGFFVTKSTTNPTSPTNLISDDTTGSGGPVCYASIGGDARRVIKLPTYLTSDTTVYVYHNFGSYETGINLIDILSLGTTVEFWWRGAIGWWTRGNPSLNVQTYWVYRASATPSNPFYLKAGPLSYNTTYWKDTGDLVVGVTYYYIFLTSDSYRGVSQALSAAFTATSNWGANLPKVEFPNFYRDLDIGWRDTYPYYDPSSLGGVPVPVYFKVEGADEEVIKKNNWIVYLTPAGIDGRFWPYKIPAKVYKVVAGVGYEGG
jgi:hypothetical protein